MEATKVLTPVVNFASRIVTSQATPMHVCMYICMYVCVCTYVCMYVCMYVSMYICMYLYMYVCIFYLFIQHAPLLWSNTTCCNLPASFICRGCSDQHHGVSHCVPFTILKKYINIMEAVQLQLKIYIYIYIALLQLIKVY